MNHARQFQVIDWEIAKAKLKAREHALLNPPEWLTRADICQRYRISRSTSYRLQEEGKLPEPSYHFGKNSPRWNVQELDRMLDAGKEY